jgi:hypothetical protein
MHAGNRCSQPVSYLACLGALMLVAALQATSVPIPGQATATAAIISTTPAPTPVREPQVISDVSLGVRGYYPSWDLDGAGAYYVPWGSDEQGIGWVSLAGEHKSVRSGTSLGGYLTSRVEVASDSSWAFGGVVGGKQGIWVLDSIMADPKSVIISDDGETFYVGEPSWSPDSSQVAFTYTRVQWLSQGHNDVPYIWVANRDGTGARELGAGAWPTWSPDGHNILFAQLPNSPSRVGTQVCIMDTEGANLHRLTDGDYPAWSPDGDWIAYVQQGGLHLLDLVTQRSWRIAEAASPQAAPAWSRDGKMIAYVSEQPQTYALRVLHLALPGRE